MCKLYAKFVVCLAATPFRLPEDVCTLAVEITKMFIKRKVLVESIWRVYRLICLRSVASSILQDDLGAPGVVLCETVRIYVQA